ncbi:unnamed protein product [Blepharisma stoltei]|uniref:Tetratricopeptide repeat protein n=1 Tax=Blepharisma stoltei TaxID=1481888 RepID=A0AAU9JBW6_9CILI|nr:unnamed protein product [Blepharisma stoltei]
MLLKSHTPLRPSNFSILNISRSKYRSPSRQSNSSSKSPSHLRKRFTPTVNKSFTPYEETTPIHFRSPSVDRTLKSSTIIGGAKKRRNHSLKATSKLSTLLEEKETCLDRGKQLISQGHLEEALKYITKGISKFSRFVEGYILRGQLYLEQQLYDKALSDFRKAFSYNSKEPLSLFGIADCLHALGDDEAAIDYIDQAINLPQSYLLALLKRAKLCQEKDPEKALEDFNTYLSCKPEESEAYLGKATILFNLKQYSEAALCFEQAIKYDKEMKCSPTAIYYLGAIKIREKDFYGALHAFNRWKGASEMKQQKILRSFAEAVIFMMKRKYKEGIILFTKLIKKNYSVLQEYQGNCYTYRAYGYNALNQHEKALSDLKKASSYFKLDSASRYNQKLSQGLYHYTKKNYASSISYFQKAHSIFPKNPEPEIFHSAVLLKIAFDSQPFDKELLEEAEDLVNKAAKKREIESETYFFRAVLRYLNNKPKDALDDVKLAIEKAEDNQYEHYVLKGLCHATLHLFQDAAQDFSIAHQLNESLLYILSYRGRCEYLTDDTSSAFSDFQKLVMNDPTNISFHMQKADLFMLTGAYDDAIKTLDDILDIENDFDAIYQKLKCFILMNRIEESFIEIKKVLQMKPNHKTAQFDMECLKYLRKMIKAEKKSEDWKEMTRVCQNWIDMGKGEIFDKKYILWIKGVTLMYTGEFDESLYEFQKVLEIIHAKDVSLLNSDEALIAEEENCEILFNIALCHLDRSMSHSLQIFQDLAKILNSKHKGQMLFLCALIEISLENSDSAESLLKEAFRCDPDSIKPFLNNEPTHIMPLNTNNDFASNFPFMDLPFNCSPKVQIRPAISLPRVDLPSLNFDIPEERVREFFTISKVTPKPEAPWLNRVRGSIQFTELIVDIDTEPTEISDEDTKPTLQKSSVSEDSEIKRQVKSAAPLRHFSSSWIIADESITKLGESIKNAEENRHAPEISNAPEDVLQKIKQICKPV